MYVGWKDLPKKVEAGKIFYAWKCAYLEDMFWIF